jgi:hypothetical protein
MPEEKTKAESVERRAAASARERYFFGLEGEKKSHTGQSTPATLLRRSMRTTSRHLPFSSP